MFARPYICSTCRKPAMFAAIRQPRNQHLHASSSFSHGRRKDFFSSNAVLRQSQSQSQPANNTSKELNLQGQSKKRKAGRSAAANTSLRRVAVEAQRSRDGILSDSQLTEKGLYQTKVPQPEPFLSPPLFFSFFFVISFYDPGY
jgi:required for meiotic nuclear division protein 1